jgi:WD40 repeat protein
LTRLENLRKEAKRRLRALRKTNLSATLRQVQHALAREHGHESWPALLAALAEDTASQRNAVVKLGIQTEELNVCSFTADRTHALTAAQEYPPQLWDLRTGRCMRLFEAHSRPAWALEWHADERQFLSGSFDGTLRLWDAKSGRMLRVFTDPAPIRSVAWSPDGQFALTGSRVHLCVWDIDSGRTVKTFSGHRDGVYSVQWSRDQRWILSGSTDRTIRLWDVESGRCEQVLTGHGYHVHGVAWASNQVHALSWGDAIRLWNLDTGDCESVFEGHTDTIRSARWSRDERRILSASHDGTMRIWDVDTGQCLHTLTGHSAGVINAVWSADEQSIHSCDWRGEVRLWHVGDSRGLDERAGELSP